MDSIKFNVPPIRTNTQIKNTETSEVQNKHIQQQENEQKTKCNCKSVNYSNISGYFPNINIKSPEANFDKEFEGATKLSDGSALIMPSMIGSSSTVVANDDGTYTVTTQGTKFGSEPTVKTITEEELIDNKGLCTGLLKQNENGSYDVSYAFKDDKVGWVPVTLTDIDKNTVINLMKMEYMHF